MPGELVVGNCHKHLPLAPEGETIRTKASTQGRSAEFAPRPRRRGREGKEYPDEQAGEATEAGQVHRRLSGVSGHRPRGQAGIHGHARLSAVLGARRGLQDRGGALGRPRGSEQRSGALSAAGDGRRLKAGSAAPRNGSAAPAVAPRNHSVLRAARTGRKRGEAHRTGGTAGLAAESCRGLSAAPKGSPSGSVGPRGRRERFRRRRRGSARGDGPGAAGVRGPHGGKGAAYLGTRPHRTGGRRGLDEDYSCPTGSWRPLQRNFSLGITVLTEGVHTLTRLSRLITDWRPGPRH